MSSACGLKLGGVVETLEGDIFHALHCDFAGRPRRLGYYRGSATAAPIDWSKVDQAIGKPGTDQPGGVHKYGLPRSDLKITVDGVAIKPTLALGSWLGFMPMGSGAMVMGDLVLTETGIEPVMKRLIDDGIEITAIHKHLLRASPAVFYMHVSGQGDPVKLAQTLHAGLALSQTPFAPAAPAAAPATIDLDIAAIDSAVPAKGAINGGVYQVNIPRAETISEGGMAIPPSLGTAIAINFSAKRRRQGGHYRRFRAARQGSESRTQGDAQQWHRGDGSAQSHDR